MKKTILYFLLSCVFTFYLHAQTFSWQADTTMKYGATSSMILFHTYIINHSASPDSFRVIRTVNLLPPDWTSSFCVGGIAGVCYAPIFDTIPEPVFINASSQLELAIDVQTGTDPDQGSITIRVEQWSNSANALTETFTASTLPTSLGRHLLPVTGQYRLYANYPNPFNASTTIPFEIGGSGSQKTVITLYNVLGRMVRVLLNENLHPGLYQVAWDGRDGRGYLVSSGIYFLELRTQNMIVMGKMFLLK